MALLAYITSAGQTLISSCLNNTLVFTRAEVGTGSLTDPTDPTEYDRTSLKTKAADASIGAVKSGSGYTTVSVSYRNENQSGDLQIKEIAIYGRKQGTTGSANEKLICYANFGSDYDLVLQSSAALFTRIYDIVLAIADTVDVEIEYTPAYFAEIPASGILKGDGEGGITAAVAGTDYAAVSHTHSASAINTGVMSISRGGTNASTAAQALQNLGIIYSATQPTYQAGAIWLQPISNN